MIVFFIGLFIGGLVMTVVMSCLAHSSYQRGQEDMVHELNVAISHISAKVWGEIDPQIRQRWMNLIGRKDERVD